jgi:hypothetical protein
MPRPIPPLADQLRAAIAKAEKKGLTRYRIAKLAELSPAILTRFCNDGGQLRLDIAERIAIAIGKKLSLTNLNG